MVDRLTRLGHDPIVGSDDDHGNVRDLRAASSHRGEGLVAWCIEEGDQATVDFHLIGADVLSDASCFTGGNARVADDVEQAGLAMVDVAHDGDNRRSRLEQSRILFLLPRRRWSSGRFHHDLGVRRRDN